jgi:hypothetical protein
MGVTSIALVCACVLVLRARPKPVPESALYSASSDKSVADAAPNIPSRASATLLEPEFSPEAELDLPLSPETEALVRWYSQPERRNIKDAELLWQRHADNYIEYIKKESFAQSAFRTYITNELMLVLCNYPNYHPSNPDTIRIHARTRRYCKLIYEIEQAKITGELSSIVQTLSETVDRFIAERKQVEEKALALMKEKPEIFRPGADEKHEVRHLMVGFGLMGPGLSGFNVPDPEEAIPRSIRGTQLGVLANTFLLGRTQDPHTVAPLLRVAGYDSEPFLQKCEEALGMRLPLDHRLANRWAVADAVDRILMSDAAQAASSSAATVARNYAEWRSEQSWPPREIVEIYPFDAPQAPYSLPGMVTGRVEKVETKPLTLPLKVSQDGRPGLTEADVEKVLEWAHRYHEAQQ